MEHVDDPNLEEPVGGWASCVDEYQNSWKHGKGRQFYPGGNIFTDKFKVGEGKKGEWGWLLEYGSRFSEK